MPEPIFKPWAKTPRFYRDVVVTEKIDGTNAQVIILRDRDVPPEYNDFFPEVLGKYVHPEHGYLWLFAGSRKRLLSIQDDNFGFAQWVQNNGLALATTLGPGRFHGEWYGLGIQRSYGLSERRLALFNATLAEKVAGTIQGLETVPVLFQGTEPTAAIQYGLDLLRADGTHVAGGTGPAEGVCMYHSASGQVYKALLENDEMSKTEAQARKVTLPA